MQTVASKISGRPFVGIACGKALLQLHFFAAGFGVDRTVKWPVGRNGQGRQLADCCQIFNHDIVLVKCLIALVRYDENARSAQAQFDGQVR